MKTLTQHLNEWKLTGQSVQNVNKETYFIYKLERKTRFKVFGNGWRCLNDYTDKVYINGERAILNEKGDTVKEYESGTYRITINDIDKIDNCYMMFMEAKHLINAYFNDMKSIEILALMFYGCTNLTSVTLDKTNDAIDLHQMFDYCSKLKTVSPFDTRCARDMSYMFNKCDSIKQIPKFNTKNVKDMNHMFFQCQSLVNVPLLDTSSCQSIQSMDNMFTHCPDLNKDTITNWSTVYNFKLGCKKK